MIDEKALEAATLAALNDHRVRKGWPAIISVDGLREQDRADWTDDARAAITAYLQALRPGSTGETDGWQPIETFDGSEAYVLVFDGSHVSEARYHPNEDGWWLANTHPTDAYDGEVYPTHWMPLPSPPSAMLTAAGGRDETR